ncbi:hypothetical protein HDU91_004364 [Kappamyces sp. JEL0680]|nr:hypothetical protein HDU91_004364 [Kappamyces sp. JEL0680]
MPPRQDRLSKQFRPNRLYLKCRLVCSIELDETQLMNCIVLTMRQLYGIQGTAFPLDLLVYPCSGSSSDFILRTDIENGQRLASVLSAITIYAGESCIIQSAV